MTPGTLFVHRFQIEECLVHTGSRRVYRARDLLNDEPVAHPVALKGSLIPANGDASAVQAEWRCLRFFSHPALVKALELGHAPLPTDGPEGATFHYFTVPWIEGPSLVKQAKNLDPQGIRQWLQEALELVAWLHHHRLTRLDLKPEHFLWDGTRWRLIDLDQMRDDDPYAAPELFGTRAYMAPEILREGTGGPSADLFSLGAILLEVITGKPPPLKGKTREELLAFLASRPLPAFPSSFMTAAPDVAQLCRRLLALEPVDRPLTAEAALSLLQETSPTASWRRVPPCPAVVGTQTMLTNALEHLTHAEVAGGGGLMLTGPSRAGHSTALESLAVEAQLRGLPVFFIVPDDLPAEPLAAVHALALWLHRLAGAPNADDSAGLMGAHAPALAGDISREEVVEGLITRALTMLLDGASLARERLEPPSIVLIGIVLIDDPGRLDALSQAVLRRLGPLLPGSGLWMVMAGQGTPQTETLGTLGTLALQPLTRTEVRTLADEMLGPGALTHGAALERLFLQTEGWAPRVRDALLQQWWNPSASLEGAPASHFCATEHAWSRYPAEVLEAARVLAVMADPLPESVAAAMLEEHAPDVSVQRLMDIGILLLGSGPASRAERVQFTEDDGRRWLLQQVSEDAQKQQHLQLAELLVQHLSLGLAGTWQESIAHHFLRSDQPRRALSHLVAAVDETLSVYRLDDAVGLLNAGLNILRPTELLRPQLLHSRGELELELARYESARASFVMALEQPGLKAPALKARCLAGLGRAHMKRAHYPEAQQALEQALELKSATPNHDHARFEQVQWRQWLAWLYGNLGDAPALERMKSVLGRAREDAIAPGSRLEIDQIQLEVELGMRLHAAEADLIAQAEAALTQARVLEYTSGQVRLLNCLLPLYGATGQVDHQIQAGQALLTLSRATFNQEQEARVANNLALLLRSQGRLLEAHKLFERAAMLAERLKRVELELRFRLELADTLIRAGGLTDAKKHLRRTAELIAAASNVAEADRLSQQLLECRLELRHHVLSSPLETGQPLDDRLAALVTALEAVRPAYLQLEALADRMELAIFEQQPRRALQMLAPFLDRAETPETALAWERIHLLGSQAHAQRLPSHVQVTPNTPGPDSDTSAKNALPQTPTPAPVRNGRTRNAARTAENSSPTLPDSGLTTRVKPPERFGLESPEVWLDRVLQVVQVADGEEQLAARLAELAGALLGGRGLVLFFLGQTGAGQDEVLELAELRDNPVSSTLVRLVRTTGESFRSADVRLDERLASAQSIQALSRPSVLCEPIRSGRGELLGVAYVDDLPIGRSEDPAAVRVVEQVAGMAGAMLEAFARRRQREQAQAESLSRFGESPAMKKVAHEIELIARTTRQNLTVLLTGETGSGKTFFARQIHDLSTWRERPFFMLNCAGIPSELLEPELFGSVRGAFNGAVDKAGAFEAAEDGTLFLDEVGELTLAHQAKLLTVLGERQFRRVGETRVRPVKARLICATNRDLRAMVEAGTFRADLLSRIDVNAVRIPSLRERGPEDIRLLICHELREQLIQLRKRTRKEPPPHFEDYFTPKAQQYLLQYPWPYNAREVQKLFERETVRERLAAGKKIDEKLLEGALSSGLTTPKTATLPSLATWETVDPKTFFGAGLTLRELKSRSNHLIGVYIQKLVEDSGDDKNRAAGGLQCARDSVYKYLGL